MSLTQADSYYLKALSSYPWDAQEVTENLNYALSYDPDHAQANCLMGRLYMEVLKEYDMAEKHFELAIMSNLNYVDTYKCYSLLKIWMGEYEAAEKVITYALKIRGMDKSLMMYRKVMVYEAKGELFTAKKHLAYAMRSTVYPHYTDFFKNELSRIQKKVKEQKRFRRKLNKKISAKA